MTFNKTLAYSILVAFPLIAVAQPPEKPPEPPKAEARAYASSRSYANSEANSASEANNELNVSLSDTFEDRRQAPAVFAPSIAPTAPCYYSVGGGLSLPGFGASGGKAVLDKDCEARERARLFYQMGFTDMAVSILCGDNQNCPYPSGKPNIPASEPANVSQTAQCDAKVERVLEACTAK